MNIINQSISRQNFQANNFQTENSQILGRYLYYEDVSTVFVCQALYQASKFTNYAYFDLSYL